MSELFTVDGMIQVNAKLAEAGKAVIYLLNSGKAADIIVREHEDVKSRSGSQNRLIYLIYGRIGKTLYGGDELHARRECKLCLGCQILYADEDFAKKFDQVIRPLPHEIRLLAMDFMEVSSLMSVKQCKEYITTMLNQYTLRGCYFADLDGADEFLKYPEAQQ